MEYTPANLQSPERSELLTKKVLETMEEAIDNKIEEIDSMSCAELEKLREERIRTMKQNAAVNEEMKSKGHGCYDEVEEKFFFKASTDSQRVIVHFYAGNSPACEILHKHLKELAKSHIESRFIRVNSDKSPFLVGRLNIQRFPTIVVIIDGLTSDRISLLDFGGKDDFQREALEWRLSLKGVRAHTIKNAFVAGTVLNVTGIKYDGDYDAALKQKRRTQITKVFKKRTIRDNDQSSDED